MESVLEGALALPLDQRRELVRRLLVLEPLQNLGLGVTAFKAQECASGLSVGDGKASADAAPGLTSSSGGGSQHLVVPLGSLDTIFGCPWCRRPLRFVRPDDGLKQNEPICCLNFQSSKDKPNKVMRTDTSTSPGTALAEARLELPTCVDDCSITSDGAICTLFYGTNPRYFLGACVLGWCLLQHDKEATRVLVHTDDIPDSWLSFLRDRCGWSLRRVDYLKGSEQVGRRLFHGNIWNNRFKDVFTKLQAFGLPYTKVLLLDLDLLIRKPIASALLSLSPPAALARADPVPEHGARVPYERFWDQYGRRRWDDWVEHVPRHQQSTGINAGVMLLPGKSEHLLDTMIAELADYEHPEHYPTYMPEQEYLGRWCGTFMGPDAWTHISCRFNYELDKDHRVPFDFTEEHKRFKKDISWGLENLAVAHFSGTQIKPWNILFCEANEKGESNGSSKEGIEVHAKALASYTGPPSLGDDEDAALKRYEDPLTKECIREWLQRFREVFAGVDVDLLLADCGRAEVAGESWKPPSEGAHR